MKTIDEISLSGKRVLVRVDLNVPFDKEGRISDDFRLKAVLPTLNYLLNRDAKVIIISHLGRPKGNPVPEFSLKPVYLRLSALLKKSISFAPQLFSEATQKAVESLQNGEVVGLENLRFDKGEEDNSRTFAKRLALYADIYVNDAFSVSHREAASTVAITEFLPSYAGMLMEKEVQMLSGLLRHPESPFIAVIGGAKIKDKLPIIEHLTHKADRILVGGGVANNFLKIQGVDVKDSLVELECLDDAKRILALSKGKIVLPVDYVWKGDVIADVGKQTVKTFEKYLDSAKTIFWNGCLGITEEPEYAKASDELAKMIAGAKATSVIGGGNTLEVLNKLKLANKVSFVSSGGGASLEYLSGKILPGVKALG